MRTVSGAKTRHRHTYNVFAGPSQFIKGLYTYQQCQGRIQSTGNTNHRTFSARMHQTLCQTGNLYRKYFFTTLIQSSSLRYKRMRIETSRQVQFFTIHIFRRNTYCFLRCTMCPTGSKRCVYTPFYTQMFHINLTDNNLPLKREAFTIFY